MKSFIVLAVVIAMAFAGEQDKKTQILDQQNNNIGVGEYDWSSVLSDGTLRHEEARWQDYGTETQHLKVSGYYEYIGPDGLKYRTDYVSDKEGYNAQAEHLPQSPK